MKYLKYFFIFAFLFLIFSSNVAAEEFDYPDYHELIGLTYEEFVDSLDEFGMYTGYYSVPFSVVNPDYIKDSAINLSHSLTWEYDCSSYPSHRTGSTSFGEYKVASNMPSNLTLTLYNNGQPLFDVGGKLTLKVYVYSSSCKYSLYYTDGSVVEYQFVAQNPDNSIYQIPIDIDNSANKLSKVVFSYGGSIPQSSGDSFIGFGLVDYGYLVDEVEPEPEEPDNPIISAGGNPGDALQYLTQFVVDMVNVFFVLEIFAGITVGNFLIACMLLSIVFSFFFTRLIK